MLIAVTLVCVAVASVLLLVLLRSGSDDSEFGRRRAQAEELEAQAASAEKWAVSNTPLAEIREEWTVDRASRAVETDLASTYNGQAQSGWANATYRSFEDVAFVKPKLADESASTEHDWYLTLAEGLSDERFEDAIGSPWSFLDEHAVDTPHFVGTERVDGEQLDRFDVFIPADAVPEGRSMLIGYSGYGGVDPSSGVDISFWFTHQGELRRLTAVSHGHSDLNSYEYRSQLFGDGIAIEHPTSFGSWFDLAELAD